MAKIHPFRGYRYNPEQVGDLNRVVTQPYDKIDEEDRERYYEASPYNIARVILPKEEEEGDKYLKAGGYLEDWIDEGVLIRDEEPSFYAYFQEYQVGGEKKVRKGLVGLGELGEEGEAKAHENTMEGPKADRLNLMRATEANFGHIFMLYSDPDNLVNNSLEKVTSAREPLVEAKDEDRNLHSLWKIDEQDLIEDITEGISDKSLYIADGHHRYETAVNFKKECLEKGWRSEGPEGFGSRMMTFVNIEDPGLTILPTHRLVYGLQDFNPRGVLEKARKNFSIYRFADRQGLFEKLDEERAETQTFGYRAKGGEAYWALTLQDEATLGDLMPDYSDKWRNLDVAILHKAVLENILGFDEQDLEEKRNIDYVRYREEALDRLEDNNYQAAFIMNPTGVEQVREVADQGEKMPPKSTDFYPKLLTGLVLHKLAIQKE